MAGTQQNHITHNLTQDMNTIWNRLVDTLNNLGYGPLLGSAEAFGAWCRRYVVLLPPEEDDYYSTDEEDDEESDSEEDEISSE